MSSSFGSLDAQGAMQPQQQQSADTHVGTGMFENSAHPTALFFHLFFRTAAIVTYLLCWIFTSSFILQFVLIVLLLAFDFWTVKNVTGRLLVGLRWWNDVREDGTSSWIFESRPNRIVNPVDSKAFWVALYTAPAIWILFAFISILKFDFRWLLVAIVAIVMNVANIMGYSRCEQDAQRKSQPTASQQGQSLINGLVGTMVSNRISSFFASAK